MRPAQVLGVILLEADHSLETLGWDDPFSWRPPDGLSDGFFGHPGAWPAYYARISGFPDDAGLRRRLVTRLESANDPRRERYLQLLAVINGWPVPESLAPVLDWSIHAVRARIQ